MDFIIGLLVPTENGLQVENEIVCNSNADVALRGLLKHIGAPFGLVDSSVFEALLVFVDKAFTNTELKVTELDVVRIITKRHAAGFSHTVAFTANEKLM